MGDLNAAPKFLAMILKLQMELDKLAKDSVMRMSHQKLILMVCYYMGAQLSSS